MRDKRYDTEMQYRLTMYFVKRLRQSGTISEKEYMQIDTVMLEKYKPRVGMLLSEGVIKCVKL